MIRLYRQQAQQLLVMLSVLMKNKPDLEFKDFIEDARKIEGDETVSSAVSHTAELKEYNVSLTNLIDILREQLNRESGHERDIIDTVVSMLNMPYLSNTVSVGAMKRLRDAILRPDELETLKAELRVSSHYCPSCSKPISSGEAVNIVIPKTVSGDNGLPVVHCLSCKVPQFIRCPKCKKSHAFGTASSQSRLINALTCPDCKTKKAGGIGDQV